MKEDGWWINCLDGELSGDTTNGFLATSNEQINMIMAYDERAILDAPLVRISINELIDFGIDHGFFDDKFPRWETPGSFLAEESEGWAEVVAEYKAMRRTDHDKLV